MSTEELVQPQPVRSPRRSRLWMWLAVLACALTAVLAVVANSRLASLFLAGAVLVFAVVRAVSPSPGPYGLSTRSRVFDVTILVVSGVVIAGLVISLAPGTID